MRPMASSGSPGRSPRRSILFSRTMTQPVTVAAHLAMSSWSFSMLISPSSLRTEVREREVLQDYARCFHGRGDLVEDGAQTGAGVVGRRHDASPSAGADRPNVRRRGDPGRLTGTGSGPDRQPRQHQVAGSGAYLTGDRFSRFPELGIARVVRVWRRLLCLQAPLGSQGLPAQRFEAEVCELPVE